MPGLGEVSTGNGGVGVERPAPGEMASTVAHLRAVTRRHSARFERSIPLIASENLLSPYAKELMISDLHSRYAEGLPGERYYEGNEDVDEIERVCLGLAKRLFRCSFADVRPTSGTVANLAVLKAITETGDLVGTSRLADGAHISSAGFGAFGLRGVKPVYYPWDEERMTIDVARTREVLRAVRPKTCLFGLSLFLFPMPIEELRPTLEEIGARGWYDAAHVLGLIAGGQFQDPLHEGCTVLSASTHKTLPGPQHGILLGQTEDAELRKKLESGAFPGVTSNHHLHAMAALAVSLAEHLEFGREYARRTIENARPSPRRCTSGGSTSSRPTWDSRSRTRSPSASRRRGVARRSPHGSPPRGSSRTRTSSPATGARRTRAGSGSERPRSRAWAWDRRRWSGLPSCSTTSSTRGRPRRPSPTPRPS